MKLLYSIYKEYKVLTRDRAGLAITFIMPTVLILIICISINLIVIIMGVTIFLT